MILAPIFLEMPLSGTISRRFSHSSSLKKWNESTTPTDSKALARGFWDWSNNCSVI
jgi:hypothetical protein